MPPFVSIEFQLENKMIAYNVQRYSRLYLNRIRTERKYMYFFQFTFLGHFVCHRQIDTRETEKQKNIQKLHFNSNCCFVFNRLKISPWQCLKMPIHLTVVLLHTKL